jgi:hypothetical protein
MLLSLSQRWQQGDCFAPRGKVLARLNEPATLRPIAAHIAFRALWGWSAEYCDGKAHLTSVPTQQKTPA